ncbi:hypothetical protein HOY82DRAFT_554465 [Tuber indicum]|nr:hypothetical protein HOY82DRAFT_554465 [Tuber indicum]
MRQSSPCGARIFLISAVSVGKAGEGLFSCVRRKISHKKTGYIIAMGMIGRYDTNQFTNIESYAQPKSHTDTILDSEESVYRDVWQDTIIIIYVSRDIQPTQVGGGVGGGGEHAIEYCTRVQNLETPFSRSAHTSTEENLTYRKSHRQD